MKHFNTKSNKNQRKSNPVPKASTHRKVLQKESVESLHETKSELEQGFLKIFETLYDIAEIFDNGIQSH